MVIDKIDKALKIQKTNMSNVSKINTNVGFTEVDSVSISKEAQKAQEHSQILNRIQNAPDVRTNRVEEVKKKLLQGDYDDIDNALLDQVSEKLVKVLLRS